VVNEPFKMPGGVRTGTAGIYRQVEAPAEIEDSHVPASILGAPDIPHTLNTKKMKLAEKKYEYFFQLN